MKLPKTAYILLWFPKPSETFIFREVMNLWKMGLPLKVFTLYGELTDHLSPEMRSVSDRAERLGIPYSVDAPSEILAWWRRNAHLKRTVSPFPLLRSWGGLEKTGENLWAYLCAFHLARRFEEEGIEHIHAAWASGPATAAWVASALTGIPFSFTVRARDLFTADSVLGEKIRDAAFIRSETRYNIDYIARVFGADIGKIHLTYNGIPLQEHGQAPVPMQPPYRLSSLGRFVEKKGYQYLITACKIMKDSGLDFRLSLAGDGPMRHKLQRRVRSLGLSDNVRFPGFLTYDRVSSLFQSTDIFLMPSVVLSSGDRDGIPTVVVEALAHKLPVIATNVSGISEVIEDRVTGLLIPPENPQAIADAVSELAWDRGNALQMAEQGRARALRQFDAKTNHRKVLELYRRYLGRGEIAAETVTCYSTSVSA